MSDPTDISRLLVPIHIDALAVGSEFPSADLFQWTNLAPDFAKLQAIYSFGSELAVVPAAAATLSTKHTAWSQGSICTFGCRAP